MISFACGQGLHSSRPLSLANRGTADVRAIAARWVRWVSISIFAIAIGFAIKVAYVHWDYFANPFAPMHGGSPQFLFFFLSSFVGQALMLLFLSLPRRLPTTMNRKISDVLFIFVAVALGIASLMIASEIRWFGEMLAGRVQLFPLYLATNLLANAMVVWYTYRIHFNRSADFRRAVRVRLECLDDFWYTLRMRISRITGW